MKKTDIGIVMFISVITLFLSMIITIMVAEDYVGKGEIYDVTDLNIGASYGFCTKSVGSWILDCENNNKIYILSEMSQEQIDEITPLCENAKVRQTNVCIGDYLYVKNNAKGGR